MMLGVYLKKRSKNRGNARGSSVKQRQSARREPPKSFPDASWCRVASHVRYRTVTGPYAHPCIHVRTVLTYTATPSLTCAPGPRRRLGEAEPRSRLLLRLHLRDVAVVVPEPRPDRPGPRRPLCRPVPRRSTRSVAATRGSWLASRAFSPESPGAGAPPRPGTARRGGRCARASRAPRLQRWTSSIAWRRRAPS